MNLIILILKPTAPMAYNWRRFMMKKLLFSVLLLLMMSIGAVAQETLTVCDGTATNSYVPFNGLYADYGTRSQFVLPAEDLSDMEGGSISQLTFYCSQSSLSFDQEVTVYMKEVDYTTFASATLEDWDGMTAVYTSTIGVSSNQMEITLSTPYTYSGGNLMIGLQVTAWGSSCPSSPWYGVNQSSGNYTAVYNNASSSHVWSSTISRQNFLPKTTFTYTPGAAPTCPRPTELAYSEVVARGAHLSWTNGGSESSWQICLNGDEENLITATTNPFDLTNLTPETAYAVKVRAVCAENDNSNWSNTVNFTTLPACPVPTALVFSNITNNYVSMSWTPGASETHWNFQYKKSTIDVWSDVIALNEPTCYISGLEAGTTYNVRVQADCESEGTSTTWLTGSFSTAYGIPFVEEFGTSTIPANWLQRGGLLESVMGGTDLTTTAQWSFGSNNGVFDSHARINIYGTSRYGWLITPTIVMDANVQLTFDLALTAYSGNGAASGTCDDDKFVVLISTDNGATWTILRQYDNAGSEYVYNNIPTAGEEVTIDLSSYATGNALIAFYGESTVNGNGDNNLHIDNVRLDYIRSCTKPTALAVSNVMARTADLTWEAGADETAWQICLNDDEDNLIDVEGEPSYTLTNLTPETAYTVKVRANCGGEVSAWTNNSSFTTLPACPVPTALVFSNITTSYVSMSWTPGSGETHWNFQYKKSTVAEWGDDVIALTEPTCYISGLEAGTTYNVRVQADCESEGTSGTWLTGSFSTAYGIPFLEEFGTSIPANWSQYTGLLSNVMGGTALTSTSYGWYFGSSNGVFDDHARLNIYGSSRYNWLTTPVIVMDANVQLTFDLALTAYSGDGAASGTCDDDMFVVLISTDNGETWTILRQYDNAGSEYVYNNIPTAGEEVTIDLSSYATGNALIAFYGESTVNGNGDNNLHIDNVRLDYIPTCIKPTALAASNVTNESATITWTAGAEETAWQVCINDDEDNLIDVTEATYAMTGLTAGTEYSVKVRSNCGEGDFSEWATVTFTTNFCANEDMCQIRYELSDPGNYGYGWYGAAINVIDAETDMILATWTLDDGEYSTTGTLSVCNGRDITFQWVEGYYDDYVTAYTVYDVNGLVIFSGTGALLADEEYTVDCTIDYCSAPIELDADATNTTANISWTGNSDNYVVRYRSLTPVFFDNFENGLGNWTIYTEGDDGAKWKTINPMDGLSKEAHSGDSVAAAFSWNGSAYNADNWLVTSQIALGGVVKFWVNSNGGYPDHYEVLLSLTGNEITDFTTTLRAMEAASGDWTEISIDLSEYDGMGYIAIHHEDYDANYLLVDDFGLYTPGEWTEVNATGTSLEITGLTPATNYDYQVLSQCEDPANDNWSVMGSFTTEPNTYTITATAGENGTIYPEGDVVVIEGESQEFEIYADPNYRIASVLVDGEEVIESLVNDVYTFTNVSANHSIAVTFVQSVFTITATAGENGTITPDGDVYVDENDDQSFTIEANDGYRIMSVLVDGAEAISELVDGVYTFTNVTADHTIAATFVSETATTHTITATAGENGTITPSGAIEVVDGESKTFTIVAATGYHIASVMVDEVEAIESLVEGVYTFTNVTGNHTIAVTFAINTFTITATAGENGTITPEEVAVIPGENAEFTITPAEGYRIAAVVVDAETEGEANVTNDVVAGDEAFFYTFTNVTANHTIHATFELIPTYTITVEAGEHGNVYYNDALVSAPIVVNEGATPEFEITPATGYQIDVLTVGGNTIELTEQQLGGFTYTFEPVRADITLTVTFEAIPANTHTITLTVGEHGTVTATDEDDNEIAIENGVITVNDGEDVYLEFTPAQNYRIDEIIVDGVSLELEEEDLEGFVYPMLVVEENHNVSVTFTSLDAADMIEAASMSIYPNPNNGMFSIDFSNIEGDATYQIIDARGAVVETRDINVMNGETMNFNHDLRAGTYFVRIINGDKVYVEQIVVE